VIDMQLRRRLPIRQWLGWWQDHPGRADVAIALLVGAIAIVGTYLVAQNQPEQRT
jgi:hypothetical protein